MKTLGQRGFAFTELIVVGSLVMVMVVLATSRWEARTANLQLRYATVHVVANLARARQAGEDMQRAVVVTFAESGTEFLVAQAGELEHVAIPEGVVVAADATITFSPRVADAPPQIVTLKNPIGVSTIEVRLNGRISYRFP